MTPTTPPPPRHTKTHLRRWGTLATTILAATALHAVAAPQAAAYPRPGETERTSITPDGTEFEEHSREGVISADGRFVAFLSLELPIGWRIFVRDRVTGAAERIDPAHDGGDPNATAVSSVPTSLSISADGRYVAFESLADNLVEGDTNGPAPAFAGGDVFVRDRQTGQTERVSVASDGTEATGGSQSSAISDDGRFVAFASGASNLVPGDTNDAGDVFVHDRHTGETERVSVASDGTEANGRSLGPAISADGRFVAFDSFATNLVLPAPDVPAAPVLHVYMRDRHAGTTERVSVASDGTPAIGGNSAGASISADGRYVAFESTAANLVPRDSNEGRDVLDTKDVFVRDRQTGQTERVSVASDGTEANGFSAGFAISAGGRFVAFWSRASNLVPGDTNRAADVFVRDRHTGETERVSVASDGTEANGVPHPGGGISGASEPAISADGRFVTFKTQASNLDPGDTNDAIDVFVRDRGPATGIGDLGTLMRPGELSVSGWATFSGVVVSSADDPGDDSIDAVGAEIVAASVVYRPEHPEREDLLLRLRLVSLPGPLLGGAPGIVYRWSFTAGETAYEVRAWRAIEADADPPIRSRFSLHECAPACTETARLSGGMGTTGAEVSVSVPLEILGVNTGDALTRITAAATLGEASTGSLTALDQVELPDASIPTPRVDLGIAPTTVAQDRVPFTTRADLADGRFSGRVDLPSPSLGPHRVWARACLADTCRAHAVGMTPAGERFTLTAEGYRERGLHKADLSWNSDTAAADIDVYRDAEPITTVPNTGFHTDHIDRRGKASYTYQICEADTPNCYEQVTVRIGGPPT